MPQRKTSTSFVKGDKRINRDGRPKNSTDLSALVRRIALEPALKKNGAPVIGQDGKPVTKIEAILLQWAQDPKHQADFVERGFGKVPQLQQDTGADDGPIEHRVVVIFDGNAGNTPPTDDNAATGD